jgi:glycosyltransferase involved in cell wall biosynthesis
MPCAEERRRVRSDSVTSSAPGLPPRTALLLVENLSVPTDRRVWLECQSLRDAGWDVVAVCPKGRDRDRRDHERLEGVEIHRFDLRHAVSGPAGYVREYGSAMRSMLRTIRRLARTRHFDVVHGCNPPDGLLLAALPLRARGAAFVFDHHDLVPELYASRFGERRTPLGRATLLVERLSFALADVVLSPNESYRRVALERGRKPPARVFVVRNAPDLERFRPGEPDLALKRGKEHLLAYVGVLGPQDGGDVAIRALERLARRRSDWHAVFAGDGDGLASLRRLTSDLGLDEQVEFVGWVGDREIEAILSTADVCLSPEPLTPLNQASTMIKVAEYMAMERPVVAFELPETRYTAADAAAYAPTNDESAFADRIDELLDDPSRRVQMGRSGRARLEGGLSWRHSEQVLLEAYDCAFEVASSRRRR